MEPTLTQILDLLQSLKPGEPVPSTFTSGSSVFTVDGAKLREAISREVSSRNEEAKKWRQTAQESRTALSEYEDQVKRLAELVEAGDGDTKAALTKALEITRSAQDKEARLTKLQTDLDAVANAKTLLEEELAKTKTAAEKYQADYTSATTELSTLRGKSAELQEASMLNEVIARTGVRPTVLKTIWQDLKAKAGDSKALLSVEPVTVGEGDAAKTEQRLMLVLGEGDTAKREAIADVAKRDYADLADLLFAPTESAPSATPKTGPTLPAGGIAQTKPGDPIDNALDAALGNSLRMAGIKAKQ